MCWLIKLKNLANGGVHVRGIDACTHIHSGLHLAPGAEWKDEYTQLERRSSLFCPLAVQCSIVECCHCHYRVFYGSYLSFHLNTLRCCHSGSLRAIWCVATRTHAAERHAALLNVAFKWGRESINHSIDQVSHSMVKYNFLSFFSSTPSTWSISHLWVLGPACCLCLGLLGPTLHQ